MPLDFLSVKQQIQKIAQEAPAQLKRVNALRDQARDLLAAHANKLDDLRTKVQSAAQMDTFLRSAKPTTEPLTAARPLPPAPEGLTLIAADGSQISPSRHEAVNYFLINVGAITMIPGSGEAPGIHTQSDLHFQEYGAEGNYTDEQVGQMRDKAERLALLELVEKVKTKTVITLVDGPLELWGGRNRDPQQQAGFFKNLEDYLDALEKTESLGAITAGYEDKSTRDLVVRLLEIALTPQDQLPTIRQTRPLRGVLDKDLFSPTLQPGERTAVFEIQHQLAAEYYSDSLALHFFYLNVGREGYPWLARVEIPQWVAKDESSLDLLHAALVAQCRATGNRAYPYALHRAHEIAVVTRDEKDQVTQMLLAGLQSEGVEVGQVSQKQALKDLPGRSRS